MAHSLGLINVLLFIVALLLLYHYSNSFRYYFRVSVLNGWLVFIAIVLLPVLALRGRNVANIRIIRLAMLPLKHILGIKMKVQGAANLNLNGPYVIVANHQSTLDCLAIFQILPVQCTFIIKKEVFYVIPVGVVCWLSGFIFINRKKTTEAIDTMSEAAENMVRENLRICVFPEGTRNYNSPMLPFKHGAFHLAVKAQVPVIPVVFSSYQPFFNKVTKRFTSGEIIIRILPPMKTEGLGVADVPELTAHVQQTMQSTFNEISGDAGKQA